MKTSSVELIRLDPSEGMHLRNKNTGEVYEGFICIAKSLDVSDFEEITQQEYERIIEERKRIIEERNSEDNV